MHLCTNTAERQPTTNNPPQLINKMPKQKPDRWPPDQTIQPTDGLTQQPTEQIEQPMQSKAHPHQMVEKQMQNPNGGHIPCPCAQTRRNDSQQPTAPPTPITGTTHAKSHQERPDQAPELLWVKSALSRRPNPTQKFRFG